MFRLALEKPIVLLVGILIVSLFGLAAVFRVPVQMVPDLDPRIISVETRWPGATPQDVEKEILLEQEEYLRNITGLKRMYANAEFGYAAIELEFPFGVNINEALILVNNALSQVPDYPENVDEPAVTADSYSSNSFMYFGISVIDDSGRNIQNEFDWVEDNVLTQIERVDGVSAARIFGGASRQVNIHIDPAELSARGLSISAVRTAIRSRNRDVSGGDMDFGKRRFLLRSLGRFKTIEQLNNLIIAERDGAFIRLQDVGVATMGNAEIRAYGLARGKPVLMLAISRQAGSNVIEIKHNVLAAVEDLNANLLKDNGLHMQLRSEDARYVEQSVRTVIKNLCIGGVLAGCVLLLFLRSISATLIGALGIPICVLAAFLGLSMAGRTINVISLAGVAFAIGMTLDNSIVALENIARHVAMGKSRFDAALEGIQEVWPAILASTLTTVMVFLPVIFLEVEAGQLYSDIAVAISASIIMSMLIATTLIPAASSRLLNVREVGSGSSVFSRVLHRTTDFGERCANRLLRATTWLLQRTGRQVTALAISVCATLAILLFLIPAAEYLPEGEESKIFGRMQAPPGYNIATMLDVWRKIDPEFTAQVERAAGPFEAGDVDVPPLKDQFVLLEPGSMLFVTEPLSARDTPALIDVTAQRFQAIPGMRSFVVRGSIFSDNRGGTRSINIELTGRNLETLYATALTVLGRAENLFDGAQLNADPPPPTLNMSQPIAHIVPDWERAAELNISQQELGYAVWAYSDGAFVDEFFFDDDKVDMYLFASTGLITQPSDLENVMLYTKEGQRVPLSAVARVEETVGTSAISRIDALRTVTLQIIPPRAVALETAVNTVRTDLLQTLQTEQVIPKGIRVEITGATSELEKTRSALSGNFALAVLIAYLLLVAVFSHWGFPLIIMTTVPMGISGGIVGLWLYNFVGDNLGLLGLTPIHQPFDIITMLGFLILIGTVVNNPILIVERAVGNLKTAGMTIADAILEAVKVRLRPVMMSTLTTVCGLSPLVLLPGAGSELYRGLGTIVLFGLLFSSIVTLTILPVILSLVFQLRQRAMQSGWKHMFRAGADSP